MRIGNLDIDEFGKTFGGDGGITLIVQTPIVDDNEHSVRLEGSGAGDVISFDCISISELASMFREMADWLDAIPK